MRARPQNAEYRWSKFHTFVRNQGFGFRAAFLAAFFFSAGYGSGHANEFKAFEESHSQGTTEDIPASLDASTQRVALASFRVPSTERSSPPWRRYASLPNIRSGQPAVAIVIDDLGGSARRVDRVLSIDPALTLSFLPDSAAAPKLAARARRQGHDVLLHIPMEPIDHHLNPGKGALFVEQSTTEIRRALSENLDRFEGYVGINNHMGSLFTRDHRGMDVVLGELKMRGLLFLDSKTTAGSQAPGLANVLRLPFAERDVFIDAVRDAESIAFQLSRLERLARRRGSAVAIAHPHDITLNALSAWLPQARARGLAIVPISYIAAQRCGC